MEQSAIQTRGVAVQSRQVFKQLVAWSLVTMQLAWATGCVIAIAVSLLVYGSWGAFAGLVFLPYMLVLSLPVDRWLRQLAGVVRTGAENESRVTSRSARAVWSGLIAVVTLALLLRSFLLGGVITLALTGAGLAYCVCQLRRLDIEQGIARTLAHSHSGGLYNWLPRLTWATPAGVWTSLNPNLPHVESPFGIQNRPTSDRSICRPLARVFSPPDGNSVLRGKHGVFSSPRNNMLTRFSSRSHISRRLRGERRKLVVTQQLIDCESRNQRVISATRVLTFSPGQIVQQWHIPFWPPFSTPPRVTAQTHNPEFRLKVARVYPYGARLEVRRPSGDETSRNTRISARAVGLP